MKKGDITQHHVDIREMWCWVISPFFIFAVFDVRYHR